jgi:hypothetical protein
MNWLYFCVQRQSSIDYIEPCITSSGVTRQQAYIRAVHRYHMKMLTILGLLTITSVLVPITQIASATVPAHNTTNTTDVRTTTTASFNLSKEIASLNSVFGEPFYERTSSNNTGSEVVSLSPPVTKDTYSGEGIMQGVGNITHQGTYVSTYFPRGYTSVGEGMIFAENGQFLTFTAKDTGLADKEGNFIYKGAMIFDSDEMSGQFADLDNQIGLYITWAGNNGTVWSKTWLWQ